MIYPTGTFGIGEGSLYEFSTYVPPGLAHLKNISRNPTYILTSTPGYQGHVFDGGATVHSYADGAYPLFPGETMTLRIPENPSSTDLVPYVISFGSATIAYNTIGD